MDSVIRPCTRCVHLLPSVPPRCLQSPESLVDVRRWGSAPHSRLPAGLGRYCPVGELLTGQRSAHHRPPSSSYAGRRRHAVVNMFSLAKSGGRGGGEEILEKRFRPYPISTPYPFPLPLQNKGEGEGGGGRGKG